MQVLFYVADQNPHRDRTLGITSYTDGLIRGLVGAGTDVRALASRSSYRPPPEVPTQVLPFSTDRALGRLIADHGAPLLPSGYDLWHWPKGFASAVVSPRAPSVGTIHDTIVMHYAEHYPATRSALAFGYWRRVLVRSLESFDLVCTVSEHARGQIVAFCARAGVEPPPIVVTYQGARFEAQAARHVERGDYALHLGSVQPHKRTTTLLEHWRVLQERGVDLPRLIVVGRLDAGQHALVAALAGVEARDRAEGSDYERLLSGASALLLPSEIEGFGLPALEAYYLGTPVVYVRRTAVEETLGADAPGGLELADPDALVSALAEVMSLSDDVIMGRARALADRFAWRRCVARTLEAYRSVLG